MNRYPWPENLLRRLELDGGCVVFTGWKRKGYGQVYRDGRSVQAHRAMWELMIGPIPPGLDLDHLCRNRACVNLAHLEPVTRRENLQRGRNWNREKVACPRGHPYDTVVSGQRKCGRCQRAADARYRAKKRGEPV